MSGRVMTPPSWTVQLTGDAGTLSEGREACVNVGDIRRQIIGGLEVNDSCHGVATEVKASAFLEGEALTGELLKVEGVLPFA